MNVTDCCLGNRGQGMSTLLYVITIRMRQETCMDHPGKTHVAINVAATS